jgi:BirA family biotin operon repressor/biotin-[acetyl-CoA-carboxylase] ligase
VILDERTRRRLAVATRFGDIREFETIGSTNRWLLAEAATGAPEGLVAVAEHQSAGRGRLDRVWDAPPATSLLVSMLLRPLLAPGRLWLATAAVGLAARTACVGVAGITPELKWPNDLLVDGAKLAGVLAESAGGAVVVGIGLNVRWAPPGAVSAESAARRPVDRSALLVALLEGVEGWYGRWPQVALAYRAACATVGRTVEISFPRSGRRPGPGGDLVGVAEGLDDDGRLLVRAPDGRMEAVSAGDVVHVR